MVTALVAMAASPRPAASILAVVIAPVAILALVTAESASLPVVTFASVNAPVVTEFTAIWALVTLFEVSLAPGTEPSARLSLA